jgi:hypothetical protein
LATEFSDIEAQLRRTRDSETSAIEDRVSHEESSSKAMEDFRKQQVQQKSEKEVRISKKEKCTRFFRWSKKLWEICNLSLSLLSVKALN